MRGWIGKALVAATIYDEYYRPKETPPLEPAPPTGETTEPSQDNATGQKEDRL